MPMIWNSEADANLMAAIMQVCEVRPNGDQMKEIAAVMGSDCTPKALTHRLAHFRKLAGTATNKSSTKTDSASEKKQPPSKVTKPKATTKRTGTGKKAKAEAEPTPPPSDNDDNDEPLTPPPTARGKKHAKNGEDDGLSDNVKIQVGEDIGEGLRAGVEDEDEF